LLSIWQQISQFPAGSHNVGGNALAYVRHVDCAEAKGVEAEARTREKLGVSYGFSLLGPWSLYD
jgi:hypothetical protein